MTPRTAQPAAWSGAGVSADRRSAVLADVAPVSPSPFAGGIAGIVTRWWQARAQPARQLRLVESLSLGPKRSVALLELDGQRFLAGMGTDGVSTLLQVQPAQSPTQIQTWNES